MTIENQELALALTPKLTSTPSILCSLYILYLIRQDRRGRNRNQQLTPITRAVVGMSIVVILIAFGWFLSTWATPANSEYALLWASGNQTSCNFQGFILQLAIGAPMYNAAIILYSILSILHKWSNEQIQQRLERYVHIFIWSWCLITASILVAVNKVHSVGAICWASDPPECYGDDPPSNCNAKILSAIFYCVPLWLSLAFTMYGIGRIFWQVRMNHRQMKSEDLNDAEQSALCKSHEVVQRAALLALLYSLAIFITYIPCGIWSFAQWFDYWHFWLNFLYGLLEPLQGVWNLCIFLLNRKETSTKIHSFFSKLCCWQDTSIISKSEEGTSRIKNSSSDGSDMVSAESALSSQDSGDEQRPDQILVEAKWGHDHNC